MQSKEQKRYWFKRKQHGWGWTPYTWEGWLVTVVYFVLILRFFIGIGADFSRADSKEAWIFFVALTVLLIAIMWRTGESPQFRWNMKIKDFNKRQ